MKTINVNCNLCDSDSYEVIFPEGKAQIHQIVKCKNCNLMYANPQTTIAVGGKVGIDDLEKQTITEEQIKNYTPEKHQYLRKQYIQIKDQKKVLNFIDNHKRGILLEIGAYAGNFCNEAQKRGWDIIGIEPLQLPSLYAKKTFNLDFINTPFEKCSLKPESLTIIVSFHVIEHIYNPKDFITKTYGLLEKNGMLILETPTYDSLSFKILRHRERSIKCDGHLYFFTSKTLKRLVESCGFKVIKQEVVGRTLTLGRLLTNIGIIWGTKNKFSNLIRKFHLESIKLTLNMRDMQRIYCEKC